MMAHHHGDAGNPNNRYPSLDTLANAPFDQVVNHLNVIHNQAMQFNQQLHLQLQPQLQLHATPFSHIQHQHAHNQMQNLHNSLVAQHAIMQQAMAQINEVAIMHNAMASAFNNMLGMPMQIPNDPHGAARYHQPGMNSYEELLHLDENVKKRGVSLSDLSKLKRVRFSSRDKCKQCGICQEYFSSGMKVIALPCAHLYCEEEILKWFDQNKTCPTCRHVVENVNAY